MKIDPSKKYTTRDGRPVEFLHRAPEGWPGGFPWRGFVERMTVTWDDEGKEFGGKNNRSSDLIEVREPLEVTMIINAKNRPCSVGSETVGWDSEFPHYAPHRTAIFREVMP